MLVAATLKSTFARFPLKIVKYRSYKNFNEIACFFHELYHQHIQGYLYRSDDLYLKLTELFSSVLNKHSPIKSKQIRGNQAVFMNKSLIKTMMQKSKV